MKLWSAEQSARASLALLLVYGALMSGTGIIVSVAVSHGNGIGPREFTLVLHGVPFLIQAFAMATYLKLRGRRGRIGLMIGCFVSLAFAGASIAASDGTLGSLAPLLFVAPLISAVSVNMLVARRLECGNSAPLMPGSDKMAKMSWKQIVLIYLGAVVFLALLMLVFGEGLHVRSDNSDKYLHDASNASVASDFAGGPRG